MKSEILSHFDCSDYIMGGMIEDNLMHIFGKILLKKDFHSKFRISRMSHRDKNLYC